MSGARRNFDSEASGWDTPDRIAMARHVAHAMVTALSPTAEMDVLDFGCGTGLLSFALLPFVRSIKGADTSPGMLEIFERKAAERGAGRASSALVEGNRLANAGGPFDLIVSSMALHHVENIEPLLSRFHALLNPKGRLAIADLDPEGGRFHANNEGVFHFGFERAALKRSFEAAGFSNVSDSTAAVVERASPSGEVNRFPIFLVVGER